MFDPVKEVEWVLSQFDKSEQQKDRFFYLGQLACLRWIILKEKLETSEFRVSLNCAYWDRAKRLGVIVER